jgi:hypothetical protein
MAITMIAGNHHGKPDIRSPIASLWGSIIGTAFSGGIGKLSTTVTPFDMMTGVHLMKDMHTGH